MKEWPKTKQKGQMTKEKRSEGRSRQLRYLTLPSLGRDAERCTKPKNCELSGHSTLARADGKPKKRESNMKAKNKQAWMAGAVAWAAVLYMKECDVAELFTLIY